MRIEASNICTAMYDNAIGSKVIDRLAFMSELNAAVLAHDPTKDRVLGQHFITLPTEVCSFVSAGVGKPTENPDDYVLRSYRGKVSAFLKRGLAYKVEGCAVVVYTRDAYFADPDVTTEEAARISALEIWEYKEPITHILVAVLASGPTPQLTPYRFTANLAGGNREAQVWTADEIRAKAVAIMDYDRECVTVAD
jgi:hypothetical protein